MDNYYDLSKAEMSKILRDGVGLDFREFVITVWNYCSFSNGELARYIFEIFDIEDENELEKVDIECMYKMLFDTNEHDEYMIVSIYPFDANKMISKEDFIEYSSIKTKKNIIKSSFRNTGDSYINLFYM